MSQSVIKHGTKPKNTTQYKNFSFLLRTSASLRLVFSPNLTEEQKTPHKPPSLFTTTLFYQKLGFKASFFGLGDARLTQKRDCPKPSAGGNGCLAPDSPQF
ncbi:hypothetical protein [Umezakia ovalisporum]|uniref:hypothetical protein n=1 Tax=Umezakia ovalisporum TaxID=75695 RepID=UPI002475721D|nr:hypothetical protein [Umezakia ovalisporum]MDH6086554.1 hypothetical protein [Umezakia ovalisporum TAC611]